MSTGAARGGEATLRGLAPIAEKMGMTADELFTKLHEEIRAQLANATKPCGCGPLEPCEPHRDAGDLQDWEARAVAAEAKLAAFAALCKEGTPAVAVDRIEAILRDGEPAAWFSAVCTGQDCGEQFTDSETGEYEFATRERMGKLLRADGWQADPVLCPACQEEPTP